MLTIEELILLNKLLQHQYVSYDNLPLLDLVRKINRIVEEYELANQPSESA